MEAVQAKLVARKGQELLTWYQVPMDFLVAVWAKPIVKAEQNSYLKIMQVTDEVQKNLELRQIEQHILNLRKSRLLNTWHHNNDKRLESKLENVMKKKLYITQSIVAAEELLQNMSKLPFKSLGMDGFLMAAQALWISRISWANHFIRTTRYLTHCPGALVYITSVFLKLLIGGKKFEALLEGVEMPQDKDEIHIEQTEDE
ncbi:hypothetical protein SELMODRAFT_420984 [Selaginella moellendorffii]|uniref:Uncharacterized protein n=1 Tax=Selaginella moellendorffii TaxID=88036 RepID=D8SDR8_SELML|nr:hypothetical protein SELMODRAFT_420984 [Selaginella moellendorffii]